MTTPKPASAPPAALPDAVEILAMLREKWTAYGLTDDEQKARAFDTRMDLLLMAECRAASAQVREAEPECQMLWHPRSNGKRFWKVFVCQKCGAEVEADSHPVRQCPAAEPVPVAQGDALAVYDAAATYWQRRAEQAEASLAACRADAERYRWLRSNDNADLLAEDVIDDAIDAARSQP